MIWKMLLEEVLASGASDLHLTVGLPPMLRKEGILVPYSSSVLESRELEEFVHFLLGQDETLTSNLKREGHVDFAYSLEEVGRFRINIYRQRGYYAVALRLIHNKVPTMAELGLPEAILRSLANEKNGLILITGPTGSGKSTTLAAMIEVMNTSKRAHILTLEDPIEYLHPHKQCMISQREIGKDSLSYASALKAALREDPDVILIGEMRDPETIAIALTAAETGHLVLSTLHTGDTVGTIERIVDVFPEASKAQVGIQLAMVLKSIIAQQLLPSHNGRVVATEIMINTPAIGHLIREHKVHQIYSQIQMGGSVGMMTMEQAVAQLYRAGKITLESAYDYVRHKEELKRLIG